MPLLAGYAVPHPPLIIPAVGLGEEREIQHTIDAYQDVARRIARLRPDTIILSSPHAPAYYDGFALADGSDISGSMEQFHAPQERMSVPIDDELSDLIVSNASSVSLSAIRDVSHSSELDYASFIPLYFIKKRYTDFRLVSCGLSGLSGDDHRMFGAVCARSACALHRRTVYIASGDLSHKLTASGPYGYAPEGSVFDHIVTDAFATNHLDNLSSIDNHLCDAAAECGLRSFLIMAGALESIQHNAELLSYEGPFGVGYAVASFESTSALSSSD
ncbi:MAG: hypothetical protein LKF61_05595 [Eggerthellaceae bacterium]|jgi:AmmeMemoRadiSam system protein B|nr:hypothetical protein [Eggerthellaceae bacterium]MCH4221168.1 hypothetical protein [Eggerthellaceae bacterium]